MARTVQQIASFFTRNAIGNCIANSAATAPASLTRRSEGLSRVSWKLSRTVLRGAVGGNADCLLDKKLEETNNRAYAFSMSDDAPFAFAGLWDAWKSGTVPMPPELHHHHGLLELLDAGDVTDLKSPGE